ncbi:MAG: RNA polymerase sigma factor [Rhodothermales bacterium]
MSYKTDLSTLETLAARLPFSIDESHRVNEAFVAYMCHDRIEDKRLVDLWTYCYVRRYFLIKFIREARYQASELDQIVEKAYRKVEHARPGIIHHDRYAQWVSVVCRNMYVNFVARRRALVTLPPEEIPELAPEERDADVNAAALHTSLIHAIESLPPFLRSTARMRFVENLSNEEIARIIGKRSGTVRAYVHKICKRFREDRQLCAWADRVYRR